MRRIEEDHQAFVLDVRSREELKEYGEIELSTHYNYDSSLFAKKVSALPKEYTYYVYSQKDNRSEAACELMRELGFEKIHRLKGGYEAAYRLICSN